MYWFCRKSFDGCFRSLQVNSKLINLYGIALKPVCCPPEPLQENYLSTSALSLDGFGYGYIDYVPEFDFNQFLLSMSLRTYSSHGAVISFLLADNSSLCTLSFVQGKISLHSTLGVSAATNHTYNSGEWTNIQCTRNNNNGALACTIRSGDVVEFVTTDISDHQLPPVTQILLGTEADYVERFAGCLANLTIDGYLVDPWFDVSHFKGIRPFCYAQVGRFNWCFWTHSFIVMSWVVKSLDIHFCSSRIFRNPGQSWLSEI